MHWSSLIWRTSLVVQTVKHLSTMWKTWVRSLCWEDPLEKEMAIHSSSIAWKIPWTEEPGRLQSMGLQRVRHDWVTSLSFPFSYLSKRWFASFCFQKIQNKNVTLSVWFSHSVVSDSFQHHKLQHARPPCPSPTPGVYQTHGHWVGDAIQPSHPPPSPSPPALNLSWHQGLFKWVSSLHHVAKVLEFQLQHQSLQWTPRTDLLKKRT